MKHIVIAILNAITILSTLMTQPVSMHTIGAPRASRVLYVTSLPGSYHDYVVQREIFLEIAAQAGWDVTCITGNYRTLRADGSEINSTGKKVAKGKTKESLARYDRVTAEIAAQKPLVQLLREKDYAEGYDAVVYNFCLAHVTDLETTHNIIQQTRVNGVPAFLIHCSMHSFWSTFKFANKQKRLQLEWQSDHPHTPFPSWGDFTGVASTGHGPNFPIKTTRLVDHPATAGIATGYTTPPTELYNNAYMTPGTVALLKGEQTIGRKQKDGSVKTRTVASTIMWVSPQGKSKVIGLTIGHGDADLQSQVFQKLLVDGVNWMIANPGSATGIVANPGSVTGIATGKSKMAVANRREVSQRPGTTVPNWIWHGAGSDNRPVIFQKDFEVAKTGCKAVVSGSCDNQMTVTLNGKKVLSNGSWSEVVARDVSSKLRLGTNVLQVEARNQGGPAALALRLTVDGKRVITTDASWQGATPADAKAGKWSKVTVIGPVGGAGLPWTQQITAASYGVKPSPSNQKPAVAQTAQPADDLNLPAGFRAELVYTVPKSTQGSWVALTKDDKGRLYASDQGRTGIYRITPAALGDRDAVTKVEKINVDLSSAQGMCWAHDSLYVNVTAKGLWRITDTDGDDRLDNAKLIVPLSGSGEHGPHAVIETEDGKGIYFIGGNHTNPPKFDNSRAPINWSEDLLLPRQWDARGHARGKLAPGGWVARCDPDGKNIEIRSNGYRNQYDIALSRFGEMFTFDADMEWDIGSPWYRPTRVCHVVSGSEFGWRSGTGKWPTYYEDSLPPVINIGPGSPTGVVFGTGAKFPAKYQDALFILDWTFGTIYAIHLEHKGSSYTATKEHFLWKKPLPVTDAIVGGDGALYFTVGGRGSQSALYRVVYSGSESTAPLPTLTRDAGTAARQQRLALEAFHGRIDEKAVDAAWPHLSSKDRFMRFAARIAIESQPVATWRQRALAPSDPQSSVLALIALARQGEAGDLASVVAALNRLELTALTKQQELAALRAYAVAFVRLGKPDDTMRQQLISRFDPLYPASSDEVNTELARLLTYLQSPTVVSKTLALMHSAKPTVLPEWAELIKRNDRYGGPIAMMLDNMPPLQNITYAFILRNATEGWTMQQRRAYFQFFVAAAKHPGGNSYAGFLKNIRSEAEETLTVGEKHRLASVLGQTLVATLPKNVTEPKGPGRIWTVANAVNAIGPQLRGRNFKRGQNLFHAVACSACHRMNGAGGAIGPDLTTVGNRFSIADLVESILEPSKVISDQYGSKVVTAKNNRVAIGLVVESDTGVSVYQHDSSTPPAVFKRADIASIEDSPVSQMPPGLINSLNPQELKDLIAYLLSGGNKRSAVWKKAKKKK